MPVQLKMFSSYEFFLWPWLRWVQEPPNQTPVSKVISVDNYLPDTHMHTQSVTTHILLDVYIKCIHTAVLHRNAVRITHYLQINWKFPVEKHSSYIIRTHWHNTCTLSNMTVDHLCHRESLISDTQSALSLNFSRDLFLIFSEFTPLC